MKIGQYLFIGFSLVIMPNLSSCSKRMAAVENTSNMGCSDASMVIGPENDMKNGDTRLCNVSIKPEILGICGQSITDYQLLTWQVDGYDFVPAWKSIDVKKLQESCQQLENDLEKRDCRNFFSLNLAVDLQPDPYEVKAGYNLLVISYQKNLGRFSVYNWSMAVEQNTPKTEIRGVNYATLIQDKCVYPKIDQVESVFLPSLPTN
jgi:hypothetical protein